MNEKKLLSVVIPVFQNAKNLPHLHEEIIQFIRDVNEIDLEFVFVDDGSSDNSFEEMLSIKKNLGKKIKLIQLNKNYGQHSALRCGWDYASGDYIGVISSDQQDPLIIFKRMIKLLDQNYNIILAARDARNDGFVLNLASNIHYFIVRKFIIRDYPKGGCDVYLFSKNVKDYLINLDERGNHGVASLINSGFLFKIITYKRKKRLHGENQTKILKRITILLDIIISNSYVPIRAISLIGFISGLFGLLFGASIVINRLLNLSSTENMGWASTISILSFFSGIILLSLGIIGEYFWRIMVNLKKPNLYTVKKHNLN